MPTGTGTEATSAHSHWSTQSMPTGAATEAHNPGLLEITGALLELLEHTIHTYWSY